jgi:hypothetical protein
MNSLVPFGPDQGSWLTPYQSAKTLRAQQRAAMKVILHSINVDASTAMECRECGAIGDVITTAAEAEMGFLDYGMARAGGSAAKLEVVARLANLQQNIDTGRILLKFGR